MFSGNKRENTVKDVLSSEKAAHSTFSLCTEQTLILINTREAETAFPPRRVRRGIHAEQLMILSLFASATRRLLE